MSNMTEKTEIPTATRKYYQRAHVSIVREACREHFSRKYESPPSVLPLLRHLVGGKDREHFCVVSLTAKHAVAAVEIAHIGAEYQCHVSPSCVYRTPLITGASSVIFAHNHPSGDPTPSDGDVRITASLVEAGRLLGIQVHDHIILGEDDIYISMAAHGYIP